MTPVSAEERRTIMVVDDQKDVVTVARINLEMAGYEVVEAFNGQQALDKMDERLPDLVLLDIAMPPGMSGVEVLARIREREDTRGIPVVMLTAYGGTETRAECENLGCYFFVPKPFDPDELVQIVGRVLTAADEELLLEGEI